jgi:DNA-directed RNA polymerase subunit beta
MPQTNRSVITFSKREGGMPMPHLLDIQTAAFQTLLVPDDVHGARQDVSLERVFRDLFPITDVNEKYKLEFLGYSLGEAKYAVEECIERDMTYAAPLKAKLRLDVYEEVEGQKRLKNAIEKEVYLGELPIMTPLGTFVINGAERVVVSQLHRSPGVVFEEDTHPNGQRLFSARIIPFRGSWVEFTIDIHDVIYVHIDKKKKFPATALLRAFGHGNNADILRLFFATKDLNITGKLEGRQEKREVIGSLLAQDVANPEDPKGEPLGEVGDELTQERLNEMRHKGVKSVTVFAGYSTLDVREEEQPTSTRDRQNHVLAFDAADPETGEVVAEGGSELTDALRKKLIKAGVHKVEVLLPAGRSESPLIKNTLAKDPTHSEAEALEQIYALLRPGDAPNLETARQQLQKLFFNPKRYDLGRVGRYKINQRLKLKTDPNHTVLTEDDFVAIIRYLIDLHDGRGFTDDIDHLGNRRIRSVGELIANQFSVGLSRMARLVKERMSINSDPEKISLDDLVNARTVSAVIQAFFGSSQLSQFMDQTNPLAELTNKRRLSALGPGGLTRERAGFEVRDVHYSQYGRMCPIETPEGPNIGLITSLSTYARINDLGFIETPYRMVKHGKVTNEIRWLSASDEEDYAVAQANAPLNPDGTFAEGLVLSRKGDDYPLLPPERIEFMDVAPEQLVSIAAALIPFLEHDDANRALMGSNMQRQSVPLLFPQAPLVGTGLEEKVARDSGAVIIARRTGTVTRVTADEIIVDAGADGTPVGDTPLARLHQHDRYRVKKFWRTNQDTAINQRPLVQLGQQVEAGEIIADGAATEGGELALGSNVLVSFMPWYGHNFEDAIVLSERLVKDDVYSSIHIQELELHVRDTKRGQEEITREIPNVSDESVVDLDERGIVRIGAHVKPGDILVGKITPKGETELSPEEKLLTAIFGEKAKDVKDSSLKVPPGMAGVVIDVKIFSRIEDQVVEKDRGERIGEVRRIENDEKAPPAPDRAGRRPDAQGRHGRGVSAQRRPAHRPVARERGPGRRGPQDPPGGRQAGQRADPPDHRHGRARAGQGRGKGGGPDRQDPPAGRAAPGRDPAGQGVHRREAEDLGGRQDGRPPRQQGHRRPDRAGGGHAVPAGRHPGRHRAQSARRAEPDERGPDPRDPPRLGRPDPRVRGQDPGVPGRRRGRNRGPAPAERVPLGGRGAPAPPRRAGAGAGRDHPAGGRSQEGRSQGRAHHGGRGRRRHAGRPRRLGRDPGAVRAGAGVPDRGGQGAGRAGAGPPAAGGRVPPGRRRAG